ncbi:MAG: zinc ribbon domain-containing protein [Desulfobacteraceae bacterium]|nr:MAG: zinc ribbon domain-containing protein [Desulfobacteraceae bacterium]
MPIYEYRCKACGTVTEFLVGIGEDITITCSHCGSRDMEKIMSAVSILDSIPERRPGSTCCGNEERCASPPCSTGGSCSRD